MPQTKYYITEPLKITQFQINEQAKTNYVDNLQKKDIKMNQTHQIYHTFS